MTTMRQAAKQLKIPPPTILAWIKEGTVKPKRVKTPLTASGFYYDFTPADLSKMSAMRRKKSPA